MSDVTELQRWEGRTVLDKEGEKIGKVDQILINDETGNPEWLGVTMGLFGKRQSFVPLAESRFVGDDVQVAYTKSHVKDSPNFEVESRLEPQEEADLYAHYGLQYMPLEAQAPVADTAPAAGSVARDVSGPETDSAITRSEEEVRVGTMRQETGRVRLRKYITTETVSQTVPVERDQVRIEREPITEANAGAAMSGPDLSEEEVEVTLTEEEPVVEKRVVPKERVRLDKDVVTEQETVSADLHKEQIDVEGQGTGAGQAQ
ncbi:MAG TPA: PRC and DUF2382 domain-containing protein [Acidimicrobiales bacterium]|nr:PRC and DUF2382 domain-containing protein [Acidimicrobiales bacterium]